MGWWTEATSDLQAILVGLYPSKDDIERVAVSSGVDTSQIVWNGSAAQNWFRTLRAAGRQGKLLSVVRFVCGEYPEDPELTAIEYHIRNSEKVRDAVVDAGTRSATRDVPMFANRDDRWHSVMEAILRVEENQRDMSERLLKLELNSMTPIMYGVSTVLIASIVTFIIHAIL